MTQKPLSETEVNARRDEVAKLIKERADKRAEKSATVSELNAQLKKLNDNIEKLAFEIRERKSWVPAEPLFERAGVNSDGSPIDGEDADGDDDDGDPDSSEDGIDPESPEYKAKLSGPGAPPPKASKKKAGKKAGKKASRKR